jgi:periplasmic divalent cation tolerance protein
LVVLVTCPSVAVARRLANELVRRRLAACVNLIRDVESVFWWQGKVNRAREALLLMKTTAGRFEALRKVVVERHPYDVPEVIALPIRAGHEPYLAWVTSSVARR